jgi:hypothetical protein
MAGEDEKTLGTNSTTPQQNWFQVLMSEANWSLIILLIFAAFILLAIFWDNEVLKRLQEPAYARGVITFLVSLAAIALAFMFAYQAFADGKTSEDGFRRGREVLTGIMGILGTIVGFYFGSTGPSGSVDKGAITRIDMDAKQDGATLIVHVGGGTSPYRGSVSFEPKEVKTIEGIQSRDGWMVVPLSSAQKATKAIVEIVDTKEMKASKSFDLKPTGVGPSSDASRADVAAAPASAPVTSPVKQ